MYLQLTQVEQAFKDLKGDLGVRPIYHQKDARIEAHIMVSFLAYCIHVTLREKLRRQAPGLTTRQALDHLGKIQMIDGSTCISPPPTDANSCCAAAPNRFAEITWFFARLWFSEITWFFARFLHVWGGEIPLVIQPGDARFRTSIIVKTGSGKTTLLRNLLLQHIQQGRGVAIIDPHGDLAEELLHHLPFGLPPTLLQRLKYQR